MAKTAAQRQRDFRAKLKDQGKRQMLVTLTDEDWQSGYDAGMEGEEPYAPSDVDGLSWYSGYIEGKAKRTKS